MVNEERFRTDVLRRLAMIGEEIVTARMHLAEIERLAGVIAESTPEPVKEQWVIGEEGGDFVARPVGKRTYVSRYMYAEDGETAWSLLCEGRPVRVTWPVEELERFCEERGVTKEMG